MTKGTLLAGPFWGEFGWEVAQWQAYVRAQSAAYDKVVVACQSGREPLYKGITDEFITHDPPKGTWPDCTWRMNGGAKVDQIPSSFDRRFVEWLVPHKVPLHEVRGVPCIRGHLEHADLTPDVWEGPQHDCKVVVHARSGDKQPRRNWASENWDEFAKRFDCAFIGSETHSYCPKGQRDLRGIPLDQLCGAIWEAEVVVGGSSGPLHLANNCKRPVVTWSGNSKKDIPRYDQVWNPFSMRNTFVAPSWAPELEAVCESVRDLLRFLRKD